MLENHLGLIKLPISNQRTQYGHSLFQSRYLLNLLKRHKESLKHKECENDALNGSKLSIIIKKIN